MCSWCKGGRQHAQVVANFAAAGPCGRIKQRLPAAGAPRPAPGHPDRRLGAAWPRPPPPLQVGRRAQRLLPAPAVQGRCPHGKGLPQAALGLLRWINTYHLIEKNMKSEGDFSTIYFIWGAI